MTLTDAPADAVTEGSVEPARTTLDRTTLNDVRAAIPDVCYRRPNGRAAGALVQALVLYLAPITALALTDRWWAVLLLWPAAGLAVIGLFVIGHDASHQALFSSRRVNRIVARGCMLPSLHAEAAWDLGHNRVHHGYTTREGFDFVWHPVTPAQYRALPRRHRLRHRLEWSALGSGAYFLRSVWWQKMWRFRAEGARRREIVRDKAMVSGSAALAAAAAAALGWWQGGVLGAIWMPVKLLVVPFAIFTQVIGWAVYVHHIGPDIRWWPRREWSQYRGQMESTTIIRMPRLVNRLYLHDIMVHVAHHVDARVPFHQLRRAAAAIERAFPGTVRTQRFSPRRYLATVRACKLYDFDTGRWLPYSSARSA